VRAPEIYPDREVQRVMMPTSDSGVQLKVIAEHLAALVPILMIVLLFSIAYPIQNWRMVLVCGGAGLFAGSILAFGAARDAKRRGVPIEPEPGQWPNRWTVLRALGWLIAVGSVVGALVAFVAGPHVIQARNDGGPNRAAAGDGHHGGTP
jgi:hypothetical protein